MKFITLQKWQWVGIGFGGVLLLIIGYLIWYVNSPAYQEYKMRKQIVGEYQAAQEHAVAADAKQAELQSLSEGERVSVTVPADWKVFTNEQFGITVHYPVTNGFRPTLEANEEGRLFYAVQQVGIMAAGELDIHWEIRRDGKTCRAYGIQPPRRTRSGELRVDDDVYTPITIGGLPGEIRYEQAGFYMYYARVKRDDSDLWYTFSYGTGEDSDVFFRQFLAGISFSPLGDLSQYEKRCFSPSSSVDAPTSVTQAPSQIQVSETISSARLQPCTDSDGGNNIYVEGTTTGEVRCAGPCTPRRVATNTDLCLDGTRLNEWYCDPEDGYPTIRGNTCPNGCRDGACLK